VGGRAHAREREHKINGESKKEFRDEKQETERASKREREKKLESDGR